MTSSYYNHMNHDDRIVIEDSLNIPGITLKQISSRLGRDGKTVREEIKKHRYVFIAANRKNKCGKQEICENIVSVVSASSAGMITVTSFAMSSRLNLPVRDWNASRLSVPAVTGFLPASSQSISTRLRRHRQNVI